MIGPLLVIAFASTVPLANWLIGHVGFQFDGAGPHLVAVWPGIYAPSGVLAIGAALVLRDLVQRYAGMGWAWGAIGIGAVLSLAVAPPALALASAAAFAASEAADLAVFTPLRRQLALAVAVSGIVGAAVDSALFLWLAFGDLSLLPGQVIGKLYASAAFALLLIVVRSDTRGRA